MFEVNAQHGLQRKRRAPSLSLRVIRRNEFNQRSSLNDFLHLFKEHLLARLFDVQIELLAGLFHELYFLMPAFCNHTSMGLFQRYLKY